MNDRDWAIVVGIAHYFDPKLNGLLGPVRDAADFCAWVKSPDGGGVPDGQVAFITSSAPPGSAEAATPTSAMIQAAFDHFDTLDDQNKKAGRRGPFGRRLWVFFAGHGFAPSIDDKLTAILTAEASASAVHLSHVIGSLLTDYCWRAGYFEQIFMFVDCCRTILPCTQLNVAKKPTKRGRDFDQNRTFYAYGAKIGKESREWAPDGTNYRGVFSMTLLEGLNGAAVDREEKKAVITAESLRNFLYHNFPAFMAPQDRDRPGMRKEPHIDFEQKVEKVVIGPVPPKSITERLPFFGATATKYPVRLIAQSAAPDAEFEIVRKSKKVLNGKLENGSRSIELEVGLYILRVPQASYEDVLEVTARKETVDVVV